MLGAVGIAFAAINWDDASTKETKDELVKGGPLELTIEALEPCRVRVFPKGESKIIAVVALPANTGGTASTQFESPGTELTVEKYSFATCTYSFASAN